MKNKLWVLHASVWGGYDSFDSFIIAATTEAQARNIATENCAEEGPIWCDPTKASCEELRVPKEPCIVLSSFNAG